MESRFSNANSLAPWDFPLGSPASRAAARLAVYDPELEALKARPGVESAFRGGPLIVTVEIIGGRQHAEAI